MSDIPIHANRIVLRDMIQEDLPVWEQWLMPGHRWQDLDAPYLPKPSADDVRQTIAKTGERIARGDWPHPRHRLVIAARETNRLIGLVTSAWESEETR